MSDKQRFPIILAIFCLVVYANSLFGPFFLDDVITIRDNPQISKPELFLFIPQELINSFAYLLGGYTYFPYHLFSLIFHVLNTVLLFFFLRLFFSGYAAFWGACIFAVHPINTEAVSWISGRPYLFLAFFILLIYLLYHYASRPRGEAARTGLNTKNGLALYLLSLVIFSYSLTCNIVFLAFVPFFIILSDLLFDNPKKRYKFWFPFLAIYGIRLVFAKSDILSRISLSQNLNPLPIFRNPIGYAVFSLYSHLGLILWPKDLVVYHEPVIVPSYLHNFGIFFLLPFLLAFYLCFRKAKVLVLGLCMFVIFLAPTYLPLRVASLVAERYAYFPVMALSVAAAFVFDKVKAAHAGNSFFRFFIIFAVCLPLAYGIRTISRNRDWSDPFLFWSKAVKASPDSARAHNNLGLVYKSKKNFAEALREFNRAIELNPRLMEAYNNLAIVYKIIGRDKEIEPLYKKALEINPDFPEGYYNLGIYYRKNARYDEAIQAYKKSISLNPYFAQAYNNLGLVYKDAGRHKEAIEAYKKAIELKPDFIQAFNNLAVSYKDGAEGGS